MARLFKRIFIGIGIFFLLGSVTAIGGYLWLDAQLPPITALTNYEPETPMRIHARDGSIIGEFGAETRYPLAPESVPERVKDAFLAAEDASFFDHPGIDIRGIIRALIADIQAGAPVQGASTITQQVARTFLLTRERTIMRKLREMVLAFRIEQRLTKPEILHLYLNQIYLGNGAYGIEAAARTYFGKSVHQLSLAETALIAGLPKAPSRFNPVTNPDGARGRRNYVVRQMADLGMVDREAAAKAREAPIQAGTHSIVDTPMPLVAEEVRRRVVDRFGEDRAYKDGLRVFTGIDPEAQAQARRAVQEGLLDYTYRHGYRGPEAHVELEPIRERLQGSAEGPDLHEVLLGRLTSFEQRGPLQVGIVLRLGPEDSADRDQPAKSARVLLRDGRVVTLPWEGMRWARPYEAPNQQGPKPEKAADVLTSGDVIRLEKRPDGPWFLSQVPEVQGTLVAMEPQSGRIRAMVGGFDPRSSDYNRAIQARRQPGSAFKPFIYATALGQGLTPTTLINDAPIVFEDEALETRWRPENYSQTFHGPTRLRAGLENSRNLVTIRLLREVGVDPTIRFASRFGFDPQRLPRNLSLSLGAASLPPIQMVRGFAVFANGGLRVDPILIERSEDRGGRPLTRRMARSGCVQCHRAGNPRQPDSDTLDRHPEARFHPRFQAERVLSPQVNYQMVSLLQGVVQRGTGWRAKRLGVPVAGKTGTSNNQRDAWFLGFTPDLVAGVYVGYDQPQTLGARETGSRAAAPIWVDFMDWALQGSPEPSFDRPGGLVTVRIDAETGKLAAPWSEETLFEVFREGNAPSETPSRPASAGASESDRGEAPEGAGPGSEPNGKSDSEDSGGSSTRDLF